MSQVLPRTLWVLQDHMLLRVGLVARACMAVHLACRRLPVLSYKFGVLHVINDKSEVRSHIDHENTVRSS